MSDYDTESNHWEESTFPAGSGAGQANRDDFYGQGNESDADEAERQDQEELDKTLAQYAKEFGETYLTYSHAYSTTTTYGGTPAGGTTIPFNMFGFTFTDKKPPQFDGTDLNNFIKVIKFWYGNSSLQEK